MECSRELEARIPVEVLGSYVLRTNEVTIARDLTLAVLGLARQDAVAGFSPAHDAKLESVF